jgi:hypothetical protein
MDPLYCRFLELTNKDISDEELFEELCIVHANSCLSLDLDQGTSYIGRLRKENPSLDLTMPKLPQLTSVMFHSHIYSTFSYPNYAKEKYEMKQRIRSLEQTLKTFMEQTKAERLSQEAVNECLSKEMEEFYDCQSDTQERVDLIEDALKETIELVWKLEAELRTIKERTPVKDKMA